MPTIQHGSRTFLLGYCTNVHPGEEVAQVHEALARFVIPLRDALRPGSEMGVGLRLSGRVAERLWSDPDARAGLRDSLAEHRLLAFTVNAFPFGDFHAGRVKEEVFRPSWLDEARVAYTCRVADVLADLCGTVSRPTISTVPGSFKPWGDSRATRDGICANLVRAAAHLHELRDRTGKEIMVCLEPEPYGTCETTSETIRFFHDHVFAAGKHQLARSLSLSETEAERSLRRHLGVCFDTCHQAVEFEDLPAGLEAFRRAEVPIGKVQLSCALSAPNPGTLLDDLRAFAEDRYFHQVIARGPAGTLLRCLDLQDLLRRPGSDWLASPEWRAHFHVPIHLETLGPLRTTQADLRAALDFLLATGISTHLEIETYTWDVLPGVHRHAAAGDDLRECLGRELRWVLERMRATPPGATS